MAGRDKTQNVSEVPVEPEVRGSELESIGGEAGGSGQGNETCGARAGRGPGREERRRRAPRQSSEESGCIACRVPPGDEQNAETQTPENIVDGRGQRDGRATGTADEAAIGGERIPPEAVSHLAGSRR